MRRVFELDAARSDVELGIGATWHGMETTAFDGTTAELFNNDELAEAFGVPAGGTKPKLRIVAHVRTGSRRWIGAAVGGYHDGENALVDELASTLRPGMLNLADRGFFSMDRWIRFSATGAHLCWRVKNGAKSVPFKTLKTLPDGSELVLLRESDSMLGKRRRDIAGQDCAAPARHDRPAGPVHHRDPHRPRPHKTSTIRVLTTLLDQAAFPAAEIAALYAERWQVEIAYFHLKKTLRGARRVLRGQSVVLARQEAWAFLLVHNMIATLAARAAALAGIDPDVISFTAVLGLVRAHLQPTPAARTAADVPPAAPATPSPACSPTSSPIHRTAPAGSGPPAAPRPSGAPGTPKKRLTPSRSRRQISQNGTNLSEVKGSGATPTAAGAPQPRPPPAKE